MKVINGQMKKLKKSLRAQKPKQIKPKSKKLAQDELDQSESRVESISSSDDCEVKDSHASFFART